MIRLLTWFLTFGVVAAGLVWLRWPHHGSPVYSVPRMAAVTGDKICRPDNTSWAKSGSSALILVTSPTCAACQVSKPFDVELYEFGQSTGTPVYYVLPVLSAKDNLGIDKVVAPNVPIIRTDLTAFGTPITPTFIRVNSQGVIKSLWTGTVPADLHDLVLSSLTTGNGLQDYDTISDTEIDPYLHEPNVQLLALSEIGRRFGGLAKVIPPEQLAIRSYYELDASRTTIVDCRTTLEPGTCQQVAMALAKARFKKVIAAGLPRTHVYSCGH